RVYANYTVTFDIGYEGGEEIDAQTVQEEDKATEPTVEDRVGYRFMGWFEEGATEPYDFDAMVLRDLHLVAQWHLEHVVTFDIGYAEGTNPAPVLVLDGDKVSAPSIAAREFYQFDGWFLGEATEPFDFAETPITETIHLVARWTELETYEITYHNVDDTMFVYGTKEAMVEAFLLDFYDFVKSPFSISDFMHGPGKTSGFDGLWNEANDKIYGGPRPEPGAYNDTYFVSSYKYMDKWLPFFDMIHEFVLIVNPDQFFFGDGVWTGKIRLRQYICNIRPGGNETAEDMYMMPDPLISNPPVKQHLGTDAIQLLEPYREDATFLGWYDNPEFTGEPITEIPANNKEDKNVYAKWDEMERFDVTFDIGYAGGESPATQSVIEGHKATKPADPARRPGYRFEGWFEDAAEEAFNFDNPITAAVALTAKWREVTEYQVTFNYNTPNVEDVILWLEDGELIVEPAEPAREGYRFLGWYEGEAENPYNFTVAPTADTVLTAKWEIYTIYTITYNVPAEAEVAPGFAERNEMVDAFLTDFYNFLVSEEVIDGTAISLSDYMHGTGKTEGYDGIYASNDHGALKLYGVVEGFANLEVQPETGLFINQAEYNKWVPLMLLWEEYVSKGNPAQSMLGNASVPGSPSLIEKRLKPFLQGKNLWPYAADIILPILAT
ncbi:MAG: InlB B-repeat-containing protein, partial [Acholeplasmatales bacterium]